MTSARPPNPGNSCAPDGRTSEAQGLTTAGNSKDSTFRRWEVQIVNLATGRAKVFNAFDTREAAELEAEKLRRHKMSAQVRRVDEPEYRADRRAFLIAMFAIGAVPGERVIERVLRDLQGAL